jgi:hypothetical protein
MGIVILYMLSYPELQTFLIYHITIPILNITHRCVLIRRQEDG